MIHVGLVDDHPIVRESLQGYLASYPDIKVVAQGSTGRQAIDMVRKVQIDVMVLDLFMPDLSAIDVVANIRRRVPSLGVLIFSAYPEAQFAVGLMGRGASGYLHKRCDPLEILVAIRTIAKQGRYVSPALAELMLDSGAASHVAPIHEQLSNREFQVFMGLARGGSPGSVASLLSLSAKTVTMYRRRVMAKMKLMTSSDLTYYAVKNKLIA